MKKRLLAFRFIWLYFGSFILTFQISAQNITQTIKGTVKDLDSQLPLPGATVTIMETSPVIGAVADADGNFSIRNIKVGRYNLYASYIGYEAAVISEVLVQSGKETVAQIFLKESATTLSEVQVKATAAHKETAINPMAMISSRQLGVEEASRYAGGIDDPARLATAFAGVAGSLSSNAIVIRGNAPKGLLWRMEGVEIPNPSHFANVSTFGGGGLTALSQQMLSNSDFYTGAFPSEFGNALSGVFDMRIRTGNQERREHTFKAGITGIDFATEGPFAKGGRSSYLMNYRYSTLALISPLLPQNAQGLKYQDLSFKLNFPVGKYGIISAWGLLSTDRTGSEVKSDSAEWNYYQDKEKDLNKNRMGAVGLNYKVILSEKTYISTLAAVSGNYIFWNRSRMNEAMQLIPRDRISQNDRKYTFSFMINYKPGPRYTNRTGMVINRLNYKVSLKTSEDAGNIMSIMANERGGSELLQLYSQSRLNINNKVTINAGIHTLFFTLNNDFSVEPRGGIQWQINRNHSVSCAYGLHSRMEPIGFYFATQNSETGEIRPNNDLKMSRAHHIVFSYEWRVSGNTHISIEPFWQQLYMVPVIPGSSFSMLNLEMDWFFNDSLVNDGKGYNAGLDITCERFLQNGYYYLITGSFFNSEYKGSDDKWRNTRFNRNYVVNFLAGKEWEVGTNGKHLLGLNGKFSLLGGDRISPVDIAASNSAKDVVYDEKRAFSKRKSNVYYLDFSASWTTNKPNRSSTWSLQIVNLLFQKEQYGHRYNFRTNRVEPYKEILVIPNISYRLDF